MMPDDPTTAFADLAATARGFGASALKRQGRIFAMLHEGRLVVKLPAARVAALIAKEAGEPFIGSRGTPMREWVAIPLTQAELWNALAEEACASPI